MGKNQLIGKLRRKGFSDKIIKAFEEIRRENFIPEYFKQFAYEDEPFPIGYGQTISQPYTIAFMLSLLELRDNQKVLEIGSGSGYVLALISEISENSKIYGVERIKELAEKSQETLKDYKDVKIMKKSGFNGLKEYAPYDRILVSAAADKIPENLVEQLGKEGILVCPVRDSIFQIRKSEGKMIKKEFFGFSFVPLVEE